MILQTSALAFLLAAVDIAETAKQVEERPFPTFIAFLLAAICALWGALVSVALWGAKGRLSQALERGNELKAERDAERKEADRVTAEHMVDLRKLTSAAERLDHKEKQLERARADAEEEFRRTREELARERAELREKKNKPKPPGPVP